MTVAVVLVASVETALNEREKEQARRQATRAAGDLALAYQAILNPLATALGKIASEYSTASPALLPPASLVNTQAAQSSSITKTVLLGAAILTATPDPSSSLPQARCAYYRLADRDKHEFSLVDWAGRSPMPRANIEGANGSHFLHDVLDGSPYHVGKVTGLVSKIDQLTLRYKSVIAVPVTAGGKKFGVLVVDAPKDTDLTDIHVELMKSLAGFLGAALALA
ncbi:GAF domain-containing protein [Streptomyces sp. A30]|uniref:GAF domain-containing protein n=1 Tax=Streptomyces sp. A30 TaxID=2789273 RepID=UPI00397F2E77